MKNPLEKNDHKILIAGVIIGAVAAGAAAYLLLTEDGAELRKQLSAQLEKFLGRDAQEDEAIANEGK
ncbi:hypothetical protein FO440_22835 [Mucilaginibacter corticis]|uniref:YtxH domain-containing protein n=1 Tax=Mucilaginibacter corticis TaxID=2597670 RepID=A0A556M8U6_9SPHI|nr:hypothetical protein [Mucilaginibacter corticis]TSJ36344.1 hypothetical protein FO440_22835 [Mucilaginibacter corticis]